MSRSGIYQRLAPFPMAPYVFITEETTGDDLIRYLTDIKACGFNAIRTGNNPAYLSEHEIDYTVSDLFFQLADQVELDVFPHYQMGYCDWMGKAPYNIDPQRYLLADEYHRLLDVYFTAVVSRYREHPRLLAWIGIGEPGSFPEALAHDPQVRTLFSKWLQSQYGAMENLERAWGFGSQLPYAHARVTSWEVPAHWAGQVFEKYRHQRDWLRFQTEFLLEKLTTCERVIMRVDDQHPMLTGIHNVLANAAAKTWDFSLQANKADGLMSSIHQGWHAWLGNFEFFLTLYVQARMTRDFAKNAWAIPYETTGGSNFRSAERGFNLQTRERYQMILGYLAAGLQGGGFWCWNARLTGYEAGEYALTTLQGTPSARAHLLGTFARRMQQWPEELYHAKADRVAAVLYSWECEAFCSVDRLTHAESMQRDAGGYHRLGAARALTNANIPWEFVTDGELLDGAVNAYPVLIIPGMSLVSKAVMSALVSYVSQGGVLIVDMPFGIFDENGRVRTSGAEGDVARLLGAYLSDIYHTFDEPMCVGDLPVHGVFGEWIPTTATVCATFDDGRPAILEHCLGTGRTLCFAFEVCARCASPDQQAYERLLSETAMAERRPAWTCPGALAFRRRVGEIDYYYLINLGEALETTLQVFDATYRRVWNVMDEHEVPIATPNDAIPVSIPSGLGCWLRCERTGAGGS